MLRPIWSQTEKVASKLAVQEAKFISKTATGAENVNASISLNRKLSQLEDFPKTAAKIRPMLDGKIRYYRLEKPAKKLGPTRGGCNVLELNPKTGNVREWYECHDHSGNVNRVHIKSINGQIVRSQHYPPIGVEL